MALQVTLYNFSKRENSTKTPLTSDTTALNLRNVNIKQECSFIEPTLLFSPDIQEGIEFNPAQFNYVFIPLWQRYYFITDWVFLNSVWECRLKVDVMGSFKSAIGDTSAYVIRSSSNFNTDIIDTFYPATSNVQISRQRMESEIYRSAFESGCFVIGIINNDNAISPRIGSVCYYALNQANMQNLMAYLFSGNIYGASNIEEIGEGLYKSLFDPFQYIVSCMWFPFPVTVPAGSGATQVTVKVGYWTITTCQGYPVKEINLEFGFHSESEIGHHPQQSTRGNYLDKAPYTRLTLYYPPFGEIPIDTEYMRFYGSGESNWLYGKVYLDFITGYADLRMSITNGYDTSSTGHADPYYTMSQRTSMVGVPIQLSKIMTDYVSLAQNGVSAVSNLFSGNISGVFSSIISGVANSFPKTGSIGSNGSFIELSEPPYLIKEYYLLADENRAEFGRPLCQVKTLSSLSGFIQCAEADHPFACTDYERREINNHLRNGFFYE